MQKRMTIVIIALIILFGGIFLYDALRHYLTLHFVQKKEAPAVTISTAKVMKKDYTPSVASVGSLAAVNSVNVTAQQTGQVTAIYFTSGQIVKKGDLIIQQNDSLDQQDLKNNQATLLQDQLDYLRKEKLFKQGAVAATDYDQSRANLQQAQASVAKTSIIIFQKKIRAPFDGKLGIRQVNLGQYVNPGDSLVSLQSIDPIYVNFNLPEQYLNFLFVGQKINVSVTDFPGKTFTGKVTALNSLVTETTRNIQVQGTMPNSKGELYPGSFADVSVLSPQKTVVLVIPQTAVTYSLFGDTVFVVKEEGKDKQGKSIYRAHQIVVQIGTQINDLVTVTKGLKEGDVVVNAGQNKLIEGSSVIINNSVTLNPPDFNQPDANR